MINTDRVIEYVTAKCPKLKKPVHSLQGYTQLATRNGHYYYNTSTNAYRIPFYIYYTLYKEGKQVVTYTKGGFYFYNYFESSKMGEHIIEGIDKEYLSANARKYHKIAFDMGFVTCIFDDYLKKKTPRRPKRLKAQSTAAFIYSYLKKHPEIDAKVVYNPKIKKYEFIDAYDSKTKVRYNEQEHRYEFVVAEDDDDGTICQ